MKADVRRQASNINQGRVQSVWWPCAVLVWKCLTRAIRITHTYTVVLKGDRKLTKTVHGMARNSFLRRFTKRLCVCCSVLVQKNLVVEGLISHTPCRRSDSAYQHIRQQRQKNTATDAESQSKRVEASPTYLLVEINSRLNAILFLFSEYATLGQACRK